MNKQTLVELFKNNLVGKAVPSGSYYYKETPIAKLVHEQLEKENVDKKIRYEVRVDHDNRGNGFSIKYRGITLAYFKYTTVTGTNYIRYQGYEKLFKNFECWSQDFEIIQSAKEIDQRFLGREKQAHDELVRMAQNYQKIKELFGDETDQILGYLQMNRYSIKKYLEEHEK